MCRIRGLPVKPKFVTTLCDCTDHDSCLKWCKCQSGAEIWLTRVEIHRRRKVRRLLIPVVSGNNPQSSPSSLVTAWKKERPFYLKNDVKFVTRCHLLGIFHVPNLFYYFWLEFSQRLVARWPMACKHFTNLMFSSVAVVINVFTGDVKVEGLLFTGDVKVEGLRVACVIYKRVHNTE